MSDVSVVVCTHRVERWPWLMECLSSLERQIFQPLEVITVVDGSEEIYTRLRDRAGKERTLRTPRPSGLSTARNLGIAHSRGDFVAFLDDDAIASEAWLKALRAVLDDETVAGVGGVSLPRWSGPKPRWMPDELLWTLGCSYRGMPTEQAEVRNVYGGSACFRARIFETFGGFNSNLGRGALGLAGCEETELCLRVRGRSNGLRFVHEPAAIIYHRVPAERQRVRYVLDRCRWEGRSKAVVRSLMTGSNSTVLASELAYVRSTVPAAVARNLRLLSHGNLSGLSRALVMAAAVMNTGAAYAWARTSRLLCLGGPRSPRAASAVLGGPAGHRGGSTADGGRADGKPG